jgi:hypothetical protein
VNEIFKNLIQNRVFRWHLPPFLSPLDFLSPIKNRSELFSSDFKRIALNY